MPTNKFCSCFWADPDDTCALGHEPRQETCAFHAYRIDPMTGKDLGPLKEAPKRRYEPSDEGEW